MAIICPAITASSKEEYVNQLDKIKNFADRIHIDLMDGLLAPTTSLDVNDLFLPSEIISDIHLMFRRPNLVLDQLIALKPNLIIIHAEAEVDHQEVVSRLHQNNINAGLAVFGSTPLSSLSADLDQYDHLLIFAGNLGYQGGQADMSLVSRIAEVKALNQTIEIGWDGGVNDTNAKSLSEQGADVLYVGSFIQASPNPADAYAKLLEAIS